HAPAHSAFYTLSLHDALPISLCEVFGTLTPPAQVVATDIDTNVLVAAESGVYAMEKLEKLSAERAKRFFLKGKGGQSGMARSAEDRKSTRLNSSHDQSSYAVF